MDIKTEALLAVAKAFYARGKFLQYDQRSMDRMLQLTPRPRKNLPPEAATEGNTTYLDCSGFVNACFYQAFGAELEADLTWHMIDYVKPRIYYYEITHRETEEELAALELKIRETLQPGDVLTFDRGVGSGHTMLYLGDGMYTDCCTNGEPNSYDYENRKSREYEHGGIGVVTPELVSLDGVRCMKIRPRDILEGDVVLCCDDAHGESLYSCFCTGDTFVGKREADGEIETFPKDEFTDSLFGRFCFAVLRPCLQK